MRLSPSTLILLIPLSLSSLAAQTVLISDSFTDGARTNGDDSQDAAWYYSSTASALGIAASMNGLSNAMGNPSTSSPLGANQMIVAALPQTISLANLGDYLQVTYSFSRNVNDTFHSNVRVGFFSIDSGSIPAADNFGGANFNAALGYTAELPAQSQTNRALRLREDIDTAANRLTDGQGSDVARLFQQSNSAIYIPNGNPAESTLPLSVTFRVERVATGTQLSVASSLGATSYSVIDTTSPMVDFNTIAFGWGNSSRYYFDNVVVTTSIPEPSTMALALAGAASGFVLLRRRRRS